MSDNELIAIISPEAAKLIRQREATINRMIFDAVRNGRTEFHMMDGDDQRTLAAEYALSLSPSRRWEAVEGMQLTYMIGKAGDGDCNEIGRKFCEALTNWASHDSDLRDKFYQACDDAGIDDESELNRRLFDRNEARK